MHRVSDLTVTGNKVALSTEYLGSRTPVTLRAGVDVPTPDREELLWPYTWDRIFGPSMSGMAWILSLTVAAALGGFLWYRTTVEPSPGFPLQYAPPPGLGPVQTEYIRTEAVPKNALTATLFYLAERKMIELKQVNDEHWRIRGLAEPVRLGAARSRQSQGRYRAQGEQAGRRVRGEEDRQVRREAQQGQDRHRQGRARSGPSTVA